MSENFVLNDYVPAEEQEYLALALEDKYTQIAIGILASMRMEKLSLSEINELYSQEGSKQLQVTQLAQILIAIDQLRLLGYDEDPQLEGLQKFLEDPKNGI